MDRRPLAPSASSSFGAARPSLSSASSSSGLPARRPSISAATPSSRGTLERRTSSSSLGAATGTSAIPRAGGSGAVPATPSSRIPFGSKRTLGSSTTGEEPPSALRRTNASAALQVDLERRLAAAEERARSAERLVEEARRETEDTKNMMRLLVADEEAKERELSAQRDQQAGELARSQRQVHQLRDALTETEARAGALSSDLANLHVQLSRAQASFDAQLVELSHQVEAADEDAQSARERAERAEAEGESMRRRVEELAGELEGHRREEGEREGAAVMREELRRQSGLLAAQDAQLSTLRSELGALRSKRADQSTRVAELEGEVESLRFKCAELEEGGDRGRLEAEVKAAQAATAAAEERIKTLLAETASSSTLHAQHSSLATELVTLKEELSALQAENELLSRRVAIGEYNPETFQCLQLSLNPSTQDLAVRTATLEALKAENAALLEQLGREGARGGEGSVPRETYERILKEREEERGQMEKRLMRLKEVFKAKSQEFLDTLHSLLGYRILFSESGDVRLNTTYAPRGKSGVTFRFASQEGHFGSMQLTGGLAKTLDELREFWVTQRQEVPCFLASVTLELYDRSTRGKAAGWVRPMDDEDE